MILEQLKEMKNFTTNEIQIAKYIINNPTKILGKTAEELGKETFTSKASIIRLCKKINVNGYKDFLRQLEYEINEINRIGALMNKEPISHKSTLRDIINIIPSIYETTITQTKLLFNINNINKAVQKLREAELIEIYGIGITQTIAKATSFKFNTINIPTSSFDGLNKYYIIQNKDKKKKVALLLTFSGNNSYIIDIAKYLKKFNYYLIGIGGSECEQLKSFCHEYIEIYTKEMILSLEALTSYTAINYVLDVIFVTLLAQNYDKNIEISKSNYMNK